MLREQGRRENPRPTTCRVNTLIYVARKLPIRINRPRRGQGEQRRDHDSTGFSARVHCCCCCCSQHQHTLACGLMQLRELPWIHRPSYLRTSVSQRTVRCVPKVGRCPNLTDQSQSSSANLNFFIIRAHSRPASRIRQALLVLAVSAPYLYNCIHWQKTFFRWKKCPRIFVWRIECILFSNKPFFIFRFTLLF